MAFVEASDLGVANVVKPIIPMRKVVQASSVVVLDESNPHIRNLRDGTTIKLDVNNGVFTMYMLVCLDEADQVFNCQGTINGICHQ